MTTELMAQNEYKWIHKTAQLWQASLPGGTEGDNKKKLLKGSKSFVLPHSAKKATLKNICTAHAFQKWKRSFGLTWSPRIKLIAF